MIRRYIRSNEYLAEWEILDTKSVPNTDGFYTDYTLYKKQDEELYICMFGDREYNDPDEDYADFITEDSEEAYDWFYDYNGFENDDDVYAASDEADSYEVEDTNQEYHSDATSINSNKLPAVYKLVDFHPGDVVLDFGGGKFDNAVNYLKDKDVTLLVYDPYNRSAEHNQEVLSILKEHGGADAAVNSNVLNVIKEPEARQTVLRNISRLTKKGAPIYITVYEGKKNNEGEVTRSGYQLNRKTADYLEEIQTVFKDAERHGKLITAINADIDVSVDNIDNLIQDLTNDLHVDLMMTMTSPDFGFDDDEVDDYSAIDVEYQLEENRIRVEVRAELTYEGLDALREELDSVIRQYDNDTYFDMLEPGILESYLYLR